MSAAADASCPCMSGQPYADCCQPTHTDIRTATEPEQVVRARFAAQVLGDMDFFRQSIVRCHRQTPAVDALATTIGQQRYKAITIINSTTTGWLKRQATVVCRIYQRSGKRLAVHTERIHLAREAHAWRVVDIDLVKAEPKPKQGRNAPCPCGSSRKYKRCCGASPVVNDEAAAQPS